ncbi:ABC transporter ATP-binding protein [uncultured Anaerovibrio sp.]|uniref:ABC transporter ATP-binding protein n=1 Tax=uncultured Anaerovibrio sp. TaxID=361586 RepID=UPI0026080B28|nr:ABC transporter ATP-binding protein [uncultured Anaerovibrio sp.]
MKNLQIENVGISFKDGMKKQVIVENVSMECDKGTPVILSGPSGCGKTSLLYVMGFLREPSEGTVYYKGKAISKRREREKIRYQNIGYIFQQHYLLPYLSVIENVMLKAEIERNEAEDLLRAVEMEEHQNKRVYQLSGGQKQRVAIARALAGNPDVIIADEPTASLDHECANRIYELLVNIAKDKILIMATHDQSLLKGNEKVYVFDNYRVREV